MNKRIRAVIRTVFLILAGLLLGIGLYSFNAKTVMGNEMPMPFDIGVSVVMSGSMEPELSVNDLIIVKKTDTFYEEQIVVFQDGASLTVHRIKLIDGDTVTTKGDANDGFDTPISKNDIKGEIIGVIPHAGIIVKLIKHPVMICFMLVAAIFLMERSFRAEKEKKTEEVSAIKKEIEELIKEMKDTDKDNR